MKPAYKLDWLGLQTFFICSLSAAVSHLFIFFSYQLRSERLVHNLFFGLSYDVMNGALLGVIAIIASRTLFYRFYKLAHFVVILLYLAFIFADFNYVKQLGTHMPWSASEYLGQLDILGSTILAILFSLSFLIIFVIPLVLSLLVFHLAFVSVKKSNPISLKSSLFTLVLLLIIGALTGSYPNSYVAKNLNDPLTSSALVYWYLSRNFEPVKRLEKPIEALKLIQLKRLGVKPDQNKFNNLPLTKQFNSESCDNIGRHNKLGKILCGVKRPNILFLILESFRAAEIGVYGSKVKITPNFDRLSKEGIFFENFYANGFQTRHGLVAVYCSLMPNYGAAIMKNYVRNNYYCLPDALKNQGYHTSWVYGSDAAFDNQITFLPKIGFDTMIDQFDFDPKSEKLGWGYSDGELFKKWIAVLNQQKKPFFSSALTMTNHHPFDVPDEFKRNQGDDDTGKYYESMRYTDAMLNKFLEMAKKQSWYSNSLIFILADTSNYQQPQKEPADFASFVQLRSKIPLLITGGLVKTPLRISAYHSQIDLAPTIMDILGLRHWAHWAGVSMLDGSSDSLAFTNRPGNYWAVMGKNGQYYNESGTKDHFLGFSKESLKDDYKKLGQAWIDVTAWLLQENLYWK